MDLTFRTSSSVKPSGTDAGAVLRVASGSVLAVTFVDAVRSVEAFRAG